MFGQIVIGPPGSGKSTYCNGMHQFLSAIGRSCRIVNLDPTNASAQVPSYAFDIRDYVKTEDVMKEKGLGPNGGLMYALESISEHALDSLIMAWSELGRSHYLLFDCPGQIELFTHQNSFYKIFKRLTKDTSARLCVVSLVDSINLVSPSLYISVLLLSLRSMIQIDLPQINVISKIDKLSSYGNLPFRLDYYTEVQDLSHLSPLITKEAPSMLDGNFVRLTERIAQLVEDFNLVGFEVLSIEDKQSMISLLELIDRANGYIFGTLELGGDMLWNQAIRNTASRNLERIDIHERWIDRKAFFDKAARDADLSLQSNIDSGL